MNGIDRTTFIGGSDVAAILGVSPWKSAFRLYQEKIGAFVEEVTPAKQRIFDRGHRWEPVVAEMLIDELIDRGHDVEIVVRRARHIDAEHPFLAAEIDLDLVVDGEAVNGEIKTVHPFAAKEWGEEGTDEIPLHYTAQVMHGLMVRQRNTAIVAALIGVDDLRIHEVRRDEETIAAIRAKEIEFWRRVQERDAPPAETADDVKWLYAMDAGEVIEADNAIVILVDYMREKKKALKHYETAVEHLATQIKLAMGNAATLMYEGRTIATWKNNKPSRKTDWQAVAGELNAPQKLIERHTKIVAGNRPLILK